MCTSTPPPIAVGISTYLDDAVKHAGPVCLESPPLQARPEHHQCCQGLALVEAHGAGQGCEQLLLLLLAAFLDKLLLLGLRGVTNVLRQAAAGHTQRQRMCPSSALNTSPNVSVRRTSHKMAQ